MILKNHQFGESLIKSRESGILFRWATFYLNNCSMSVPKNENYRDRGVTLRNKRKQLVSYCTAFPYSFGYVITCPCKRFFVGVRQDSRPNYNYSAGVQLLHNLFLIFSNLMKKLYVGLICSGVQLLHNRGSLNNCSMRFPKNEIYRDFYKTISLRSPARRV